MNTSKIPKKIFQTWKTSSISENLKLITDTWKLNNPGYDYFLYDDNMCRNFISESFNKEVLDAYDKIKVAAYKADLWRYCILYKYGGFYADIDTLCIGKIQDFINQNVDYIVPIDLNNGIGNYCLFNSFIGTVPKNPILLQCIMQIVYNINHDVIPTFNLDISGPGLLGQKTNIYLGLPPFESFIGSEGIKTATTNENNVIIKTIHFLHFNQYTEYVADENNNILFQNKNGNVNIKNAYIQECEINKINFEWGQMKPY
jgi:mannosyltransferase OCH1-like enzyme